jgi:hypothetical protein
MQPSEVRDSRVEQIVERKKRGGFSNEAFRPAHDYLGVRWLCIDSLCR